MFDEAMNVADEAAWEMLSTARARVWQSGKENEARMVRAIEMPRETGGDYREGGRVATVNFLLEVEAAPLRAEPVGLAFGYSGARDGWLVEWRGVEYRIEAMTWQGETVTLTLGSKADSSGGW
jgi:hypothetical protein